jgi:hypothetical protein
LSVDDIGYRVDDLGDTHNSSIDDLDPGRSSSMDGLGDEYICRVGNLVVGVRTKMTLEVINDGLGVEAI